MSNLVKVRKNAIIVTVFFVALCVIGIVSMFTFNRVLGLILLICGMFGAVVSGCAIHLVSMVSYHYAIMHAGKNKNKK